MNFDEWKRKVYPTLTDVQQLRFRAIVREMRAAGWNLYDACVHAACTYDEAA
jgi:hypothetical protein